MAVMYTKQLDRSMDTQILVCGGGVAGVAAAIASARLGVKTLLVERSAMLGGCATSGLVGPFMTCFDLKEERQIIRGIFDEIVLEMERRCGAIHPAKVSNGTDYASYSIRGHAHVTPFDPEVLRSVLFDKLYESGAELLLYSSVIDTIAADGRVKGVILAQKEGLCAVYADIVIDCTGDGDVMVSSGTAYEKGRKEDGLMQPMTLFLRIAGVDDQAVDDYVKAHPENYGRLFASIIEDTQKVGDCPIYRERIGVYKMLNPGEWRVNTTRIFKKDGTVSADLTEAEVEGRRQADALIPYFRKYFPGFKNARLIQAAATIGVRETRRLCGSYVLKMEDMQEDMRFDDCIALCSYPVDIHSPTGKGGGVIWNEATIDPPNQYQIPYRILVPEVMDGLLVAGRCVSATHEALGSIRVMPPCFATGQAAGTAAALCVQTGVQPRHVDISVLQDVLRKNDVVLD